MKELHHFIGGAAAVGDSGRFGDVFDPSTGEVQARVPLASRAEMRRAVEAALEAFPRWAAVNPQRRARVMFAFKSLLEAHMDELAALLSINLGIMNLLPMPMLDGGRVFFLLIEVVRGAELEVAGAAGEFPPGLLGERFPLAETVASAAGRRARVARGGAPRALGKPR